MVVGNGCFWGSGLLAASSASLFQSVKASRVSFTAYTTPLAYTSERPAVSGSLARRSARIFKAVVTPLVGDFSPLAVDGSTKLGNLGVTSYDLNFGPVEAGVFLSAERESSDVGNSDILKKLKTGGEFSLVFGYVSNFTV